MGLQRGRHNWSDGAHIHTRTHCWSATGLGHRDQGEPRKRRVTQAVAAGVKSKQLTRLVSTPAPWSLQVHPEASVDPGLDSVWVISTPHHSPRLPPWTWSPGWALRPEPTSGDRGGVRRLRSLGSPEAAGGLACSHRLSVTWWSLLHTPLTRQPPHGPISTCARDPGVRYSGTTCFCEARNLFLVKIQLFMIFLYYRFSTVGNTFSQITFQI